MTGISTLIGNDRATVLFEPHRVLGNQVGTCVDFQCSQARYRLHLPPMQTITFQPQVLGNTLGALFVGATIGLAYVQLCYRPR